MEDLAGVFAFIFMKALFFIVPRPLCRSARKPCYRLMPFLIMTWYRPPDSTVGKFRLFETLVGRIDAECVEFYIMGDMNCNVAASQLDHNSNYLINTADVYGLHQLICEPMRVSNCTSLIDMIFANSLLTGGLFRCCSCQH
jgi:hypothetical protein